MAANESSPDITIKAYIDTEVFVTFSKFNSYTLSHRKLTIWLFPLVMVGFAIAHIATGGILLGFLFMLLGIFIPLGSIALFNKSVQNQVRKFNLDKPRLAYSIVLTKEGFTVDNGKEHVTYPWDKAFAAYRIKGYSYLYVTKAKSFILPDKDIDGEKTGADLWAYLEKQVPKGRARSYLKS